MDVDSYQRVMDLLFIAPKRCCILLNPISKRDGELNASQYEIYSIRSNDIGALKNILRDLVTQADKCETTLFINTPCLSRLATDEKTLLISLFQFERRGILYVRRPQILESVPFEVVPVRETDDGFTIVNNEYYATAYNVRNIYREVLSSYATRAEADLLFELYHR